MQWSLASQSLQTSYKGRYKCSKSLTHLFLDPFLALLSSALYLRRSELAGCIFQAQMDFGWVWPKRDTEE